MSLFIASLNSGSNGNCYYVGNNNEAVLIDAGISCRETEKRMKRLGLSMNKLKAVFISHEHSDHISGIETISKKYNLTVHISAETLKNSGLSIERNRVAPFSQKDPIAVGDLSIHAFPKLHDAADPHSFMVVSHSVKVGIFTDIGLPCEQVTHYFKQCSAAFLESNYDEGMLESGGYPIHLKKRIRGEKGHMSNAAALQLFREHRAPGLSHLILSHLSKKNNDPHLVEEMFRPFAGNTNIIVASRYVETSVYEIKNAGLDAGSISPVLRQPKPVQLSIFE
jgi:phosphoribosyl 1,2-cyclic phosphodiesterase